ncbi:hypothetical protein N5P37_000813 [Trichoderma harzianum]|nr:hypothetical protein N5P37_000813 [Trichoderma harzianum]
MGVVESDELVSRIPLSSKTHQAPFQEQCHFSQRPPCRPETQVASGLLWLAQSREQKSVDLCKVFDGGVGPGEGQNGCPLSKGVPIRRGHGQPQGEQPRRLTVVNYQLLGPLHFLPWMRETGWETPGRWLLPSF